MNPRLNCIKLVLSSVSVICLAFPLSGSATEQNPGAWAIVSTSDAFRSEEGDSQWLYWFDAQARYFDIGSGINQYLLRPAIGYKFENGIRGWIGYARFRARNRAGRVADENRYWQQIDWTAGHWNDGRLSMRVRLEQRSISIGDDIGLVARFMAKYVMPVGESGNANLIFAIEPFVDLRDTDWGGDSGLGQNRVFIGLGQRITDGLAIEAGYMNQYVRIDDAENLINHIAVLNFKVKF